jgi:hypothetical protein
MLHGRSRRNEYHAKNDENMGEGRKLRGKEETGTICFMAIGGMDPPVHVIRVAC